MFNEITTTLHLANAKRRIIYYVILAVETQLSNGINIMEIKICNKCPAHLRLHSPKMSDGCKIAEAPREHESSYENGAQNNFGRDSLLFHE